MHLTRFSKLAITILFVGGVFFGVRKGMETGIIPTPGIMKAMVVQKVQLPPLKEALVENVTPARLPSDSPANVQNTLIRVLTWEWNAIAGFAYSNGGADTTVGSLMEKHRVNLHIERQDDSTEMGNQMIACAKEIAGGAKQCSTGANAAIIMGDGAGQFIAGVNQELLKLGPQYRAVVIGAPGYSRGEDSFMAPPEVKANAKSFAQLKNGNTRGILISGVVRDGDWDIALNWAGNNDIKNNPDLTTWDPDALNWTNAKDYNVAAADYNAGKCEDRKEVHDGHPTGATVHVCINAVVTWTPGDVTVVKGKGGLVKVVSSKEYRSQMPAVIVGPKAFFDSNREEVSNMLAAMFEGGDQVKAFDVALHKSAEIQAKIYNDKDADADYWYSYYKGKVEKDSPTGLEVSLGGSAVNNLQDNKILFGMVQGANDNFRSTYTTFANICTAQYPEMFAKSPIPDVSQVEDKSFISQAESVIAEVGSAADVPKFEEKPSVANEQVVSKRSISINFDTGKATFTPYGASQMAKLKDELAINGGLFLRIVGYTDNTGDEQRTNLPLSQARANAVRTYLQQRAPTNFPQRRFTSVMGLGSQDPVGDNRTNEGRAANRRVVITQVGTKD